VLLVKDAAKARELARQTMSEHCHEPPSMPVFKGD
jgi:hypothetical protein